MGGGEKDHDKVVVWERIDVGTERIPCTLQSPLTGSELRPARVGAEAGGRCGEEEMPAPSERWAKRLLLLAAASSDPPRDLPSATPSPRYILGEILSSCLADLQFDSLLLPDTYSTCIFFGEGKTLISYFCPTYTPLRFPSSEMLLVALLGGKEEEGGPPGRL